MFESEGDNKKSKEKRLFCCHYQNIYVLLQKQKTRGHHQHRIIWERALPGLRCKDKNKNGIYQRFFRKSSLIPVIAWLWHDIALYWAILRHCRAENNTSGGKFRQDYHRDLE